MRVGIAVYCEVCKRMKKPHGRSAPLAASYCDEECDGYHRMPFAGCLWPNENEKEFGNKICRDATREVPDEAVKGGGVMSCRHRFFAVCEDCGVTFVLSYTNDDITSLERRVKELESKLGAADRTSAVTAAKPMRPAESATGTTAAPSVPAEYWSHLAVRWEHAISCVDVGMDIPARYAVDEAKKLVFAYQLAAEITRIYESTQHVAYDYSTRMHDFTCVCLAFVRGEPLPQKGG